MTTIGIEGPYFEYSTNFHTKFIDGDCRNDGEQGLSYLRKDRLLSGFIRLELCLLGERNDLQELRPVRFGLT